MTGETELQFLIILISGVATFTDLRSRKIPNLLTFPSMAIGLLYSGWTEGLPGLSESALAVVLGFVLFIWMFALGIMGAGDVKLLMAFGALGGVSYVLDVAILSVLVGGVMAAFILLLKRGLRDFLLRMQVVLIGGKPVIDPSSKMPFGVALTISALWVALDNPLIRWGVRPWA